MQTKNNFLRILLFLAASMIWGLPAMGQQEPQNTNSAIGTNIAGSYYFTSDWMLLNIMPRSTQWGANCDSCTLDLDENGWPRSIPYGTPIGYVYTGIFFDNQGHYPTGQYTVLYEGEGLIDWDGAVKNEALSSPGRDIIEVTNPSNNGIWMAIMQTDPNGTGEYIRNMRIILPGGICNGDIFTYHEDESTCQEEGDEYLSFVDGYENGTLFFHPLYLADLRKYKALRFTNFFDINANPMDVELTWANRPKLTDVRWGTGRGAPVEAAIAMANAVQADPWLNISIRASDDYVLNLAAMTRDRLSANQKVYIEYHNEIWNQVEPYASAYNWARAQADLAFPGAGNEAFPNWVGMRNYQICQMFKSVFDENSDQVRCVMAGSTINEYAAWLGVSDYNRSILECPLFVAQNGGVACHENMWGFATGPYFGYYVAMPQNSNVTLNWTLDADGGLNQLFTEVTDGGLIPDEIGALPDLYWNMQRNSTTASDYGLQWVAYEGGQHLFPTPDMDPLDERIIEMFRQANRDPRMGEIYTDLLNRWRNLGGSLFMNFHAIDLQTTFGLKEYQTQQPLPKFQAVMDFIDNNPCWWTGCGQ